MKSLILAASALAAAAFAAPAFAADSSATAVTGYTNLGYANADSEGADYNILGGRAGFKVGQYVGAEAELAFGIGTTDVGGVSTKVQDAYAGYVVAHLPLSPNAEVFVRGGYGYTNMHYSAGGAIDESGDASWNFGAGAQYFVTAQDGVRLDYTREEFRNDGGHSNVWGVAWVHRFH